MVGYDLLQAGSMVVGIAIEPAIWWLLLSSRVALALHHFLSFSLMQWVNRCAGSLLLDFWDSRFMNKVEMIEETKLYNYLISLHTGDIEHVNGSLMKHLKGVFNLLKKWGAHSSLCIAGLYHSVYSTAGFNQEIISKNNRGNIKEMIGESAEKIVYLYCASDRDFFWPKIGNDINPIFLDRFSSEKYYLSIEDLRNYCELTVANELEIATGNSDFIKKYGDPLRELFQRMDPYISRNANDHILEVLGK